ncbi:LxmA leader domain family RiPP [Streptomyces sediminimaris]
MNAADQLLEGYTAYTTAEEFGGRPRTTLRPSQPVDDDDL